MPICPRVHFSRFDPKVPHFSRKYPPVHTPLTPNPKDVLKACETLLSHSLDLEYSMGSIPSRSGPDMGGDQIWMETTFYLSKTSGKGQLYPTLKGNTI